jgi:alpha-L-arabinofuranosidase
MCPRSGKGKAWRKYEQRYPEMKTKEIFMSNDEYAYTGGQTDLKLALAYAMVFNEMLRETDFLRMTAFTMGVSTLDYNQTAATLNTNGLLFKLYGELLGAGSIPVALTAIPHNLPPCNISWETCRGRAPAALRIR